MHSLTRREASHWRVAMRYHPGKEERLLGWMPHVVRAPGLTEWERSFNASTLARARSPRFRPSEKQLAIMRCLADTFQASTLRVIED